jgi:hypothetical protein
VADNRLRPVAGRTRKMPTMSACGQAYTCRTGGEAGLPHCFCGGTRLARVPRLYDRGRAPARPAEGQLERAFRRLALAPGGLRRLACPAAALAAAFRALVLDRFAGFGCHRKSQYPGCNLQARRSNAGSLARDYSTNGLDFAPARQESGKCGYNLYTITRI